MNEEKNREMDFSEPPHDYLRIKRCLDVLISALCMIVFCIPFLLVSVLIYLDDPGPVVFVQKRIGRNGRIFPVYKLCTMRMKTGADGAERSYITRIGRLLRKSSADELLQLINVIRGDMSLVGPRPLIPEEEIHRMRTRCGVYALRPGITGLAQIHGRDKLNAAEKLRWDVEYLRTVSLKTDAQILWKTVSKVLRCEDIIEK